MMKPLPGWLKFILIAGLLCAAVYVSIPSLLAAQFRARGASPMKADMRSLATAIESYAVDNNVYPSARGVGASPLSLERSQAALKLLTTPISYITQSRLNDRFNNAGEGKDWFFYVNLRELTLEEAEIAFGPNQNGSWAWMIPANFRGDKTNPLEGLKSHGYILLSVGPDGRNDLLERRKLDLGSLHDPTNGIISPGDYIRTDKGVWN